VLFAEFLEDLLEGLRLLVGYFFFAEGSHVHEEDVGGERGEGEPFLEFFFSGDDITLTKRASGLERLGARKKEEKDDGVRLEETGREK
jgi:hypothetical protein